MVLFFVDATAVPVSLCFVCRFSGSVVVLFFAIGSWVHHCSYCGLPDGPLLFSCYKSDVTDVGGERSLSEVSPEQGGKLTDR